jgi:hypothetical protein
MGPAIGCHVAWIYSMLFLLFGSTFSFLVEISCAPAFDALFILLYLRGCTLHSRGVFPSCFRFHKKGGFRKGVSFALLYN